MSRRVPLLLALLVGILLLTGASFAGYVAAPDAPVVYNDQANNDSNFACFNDAGIAYYEYRLPLPHECNAGDMLVEEPPIRMVFQVTLPASALGNTTQVNYTETCFTNPQNRNVDVETPDDYDCTITVP